MADYKLQLTIERPGCGKHRPPHLTSLPKEGFGVQYIADSFSLIPPEEGLEMSCEALVLGTHQVLPSY